MSELSDLLLRFQNIQLSDIKQPKRIAKNTYLVRSILLAADTNAFGLSPDEALDKPYILQKVDQCSTEYKDIVDAFHSTASRGEFIVRKIKRVCNLFLLAQFLVKESYKSSTRSITTCNRFHGTKPSNINSICQTNFNWRMLGCYGMRGNKFGNGVSFSPGACYASRFPRNHNTRERVMFVVKILEGNRQYGHSSIYVPTEPNDTTMSPCGNVIVKYEDNEFYPHYIIYYN